MLRVVLDSTVFCQDFLLASDEAIRLRTAASEGRIAVHVSQIVVDEVLRRYSEDIRDEGRSLESKLRPFAGGRFGRVITADIEADLRSARDGYPMVLDDLLKLPGFLVEPYPEVQHETLVKRDLERRLPFRSSKEKSSTGYRDSLVWLTVIEIAKKFPADEVLFVTNNSVDYTDTKIRSGTGK
jgi:hypothetical protein